MEGEEWKGEASGPERHDLPPPNGELCQRKCDLKHLNELFPEYRSYLTELGLGSLDDFPPFQFSFSPSLSRKKKDYTLFMSLL